MPRRFCYELAPGNPKNVVGKWLSSGKTENILSEGPRPICHHQTHTVDGFEGSIHQAGSHYMAGEPCNGWEQWYVEENGSLLPIDVLRQRYLFEHGEESPACYTVNGRTMCRLALRLPGL